MLNKAKSSQRSSIRINFVKLILYHLIKVPELLKLYVHLEKFFSNSDANIFFPGENTIPKFRMHCPLGY